MTEDETSQTAEEVSSTSGETSPPVDDSSSRINELQKKIEEQNEKLSQYENDLKSAKENIENLEKQKRELEEANNVQSKEISQNYSAINSKLSQIIKFQNGFAKEIKENMFSIEKLKSLKIENSELDNNNNDLSIKDSYKQLMETVDDLNKSTKKFGKSITNSYSNVSEDLRNIYQTINDVIDDPYNSIKSILSTISGSLKKSSKHNKKTCECLIDIIESLSSKETANLENLSNTINSHKEQSNSCCCRNKVKEEVRKIKDLAKRLNELLDSESAKKLIPSKTRDLRIEGVKNFSSKIDKVLQGLVVNDEQLELVRTKSGGISTKILELKEENTKLAKEIIELSQKVGEKENEIKAKSETIHNQFKIAKEESEQRINQLRQLHKKEVSAIIAALQKK